MVDEACEHLMLADNTTGLIAQTDSSSELLALSNAPCTCKHCEAGWTESVGSPIFTHCNTPRTVQCDFKDIVLCNWDTPCTNPPASPPNGIIFTLTLVPSGVHADHCCLWIGSGFANGVTWNVWWCPRWWNAFNPPETLLWLSYDWDSGAGIVTITYFLTYTGADIYTAACLPENGNWLDNKRVCVGAGDCDTILPVFGGAADSGQGRIRW